MSPAPRSLAAAAAAAVVVGAVTAAGAAWLTDDSITVVDAHRTVREVASTVSVAAGTSAAEAVVRAVDENAGELPSGTEVLVADAGGPVGRDLPRRPGTVTPAAAPTDPARVASADDLDTLAASADTVDALVAVGAAGASTVRVVVRSPRRDVSLLPLAVLTGLVTLVAVLLAAPRRRSDEVPEPVPEPASPPPATSPPDGALAGLIDDVVDLAPQLPEGLAWRANRALERVGVETFDGDGQRFDPDVHQVVGTTGPRSPEEAGRVASTERAGYRTRDRVLRPALVVVYRPDAAPSTGDGPPA